MIIFQRQLFVLKLETSLSTFLKKKKKKKKRQRVLENWICCKGIKSFPKGPHVKYMFIESNINDLLIFTYLQTKKKMFIDSNYIGTSKDSLKNSNLDEKKKISKT